MTTATTMALTELAEKGAYVDVLRQMVQFMAQRLKALTAVIQEAYAHGISTRSLDDLVKALGMSDVSKNRVSRLCAELDERVGAFLNRPIEGTGPWLGHDRSCAATATRNAERRRATARRAPADRRSTAGPDGLVPPEALLALGLALLRLIGTPRRAGATQVRRSGNDQ
jgi:hypothetical protein